MHPRYSIEHLLPDTFTKEHSKAWIAYRDNETPFLIEDIPGNQYTAIHNYALTSLALHLTRLQLINQCLPNA